jgi:uncharacterized protein (UPF0264 family)
VSKISTKASKVVVGVDFIKIVLFRIPIKEETVYILATVVRG